MTDYRRMTPERRSLLATIEREVCECCRPAVRRVARSFVGQRLRVRWVDVVLPEQLALAVRLLDSGMGRPEASVALRVRLQVSKTTAYKLIRAALDARRVAVLPPSQASADGLRQLALALGEDDRP